MEVRFPHFTVTNGLSKILTCVSVHLFTCIYVYTCIYPYIHIRPVLLFGWFSVGHLLISVSANWLPWQSLFLSLGRQHWMRDLCLASHIITFALIQLCSFHSYPIPLISIPTHITQISVCIKRENLMHFCWSVAHLFMVILCASPFKPLLRQEHGSRSRSTEGLWGQVLRKISCLQNYRFFRESRIDLLRVERLLLLAGKTHQHVGVQCPQLCLGLHITSSVQFSGSCSFRINVLTLTKDTLGDGLLSLPQASISFCHFETWVSHMLTW